MSPRSKGIVRGASESGWGALANGRWAAAKRAFAQALQAGETPEAFEGLSWAAWWLDDAEAVFDAREQAFRLYRDRGDPSSAARMATWLAADQLDFRGALPIANGWLRRAHRLLDPLEAGPDHGWLAFHEGYLAFILSDDVRSSALAARASDLGRRFKVPDLEMLGLALEGAALVARGEVAEGMARLDEAAATALESDATIPISRAWACCFLVTACEVVRDYPRAYQWCDRIAEFSERYGSRYMLAFCRAHYGAIDAWRGRWKEAQAELEAAITEYSLSRPAFVSGALVGLAELRRKQGRWDEAERLLDEADFGSTLLCRASLTLDRGDARGAIELAERTLRQIPEHRGLQRASVLELLVRARAIRRELPQASDSLEELREIARLGGTAPLVAAADMAAGILSAARGDHEEARRLLEDAIDRLTRSGAPFEAARGRIELAETLVALGRNDASRREARASLEILTTLGAEAEARRARRLLGASVGGDAETTELRELTRREREVLRWVAKGLTNRQVAEHLGISEHTVHRHVTNILRKLDLPSRTAAAAHAVRLDLFARPNE